MYHVYKHCTNHYWPAAMECPGDTVYNPFGTTCATTCANPPGTRCVRADAWQEGCACPEGMVMNGDKCIFYHQCGCQDPHTGSFIDVSQPMHTNAYTGNGIVKVYLRLPKSASRFVWVFFNNDMEFFTFSFVHGISKNL